VGATLPRSPESDSGALGDDVMTSPISRRLSSERAKEESQTLMVSISILNPLSLACLDFLGRHCESDGFLERVSA
jgi:hypothetical protein